MLFLLLVLLLLIVIVVVAIAIVIIIPTIIITIITVATQSAGLARWRDLPQAAGYCIPSPFRIMIRSPHPILLPGNLSTKPSPSDLLRNTKRETPCKMQDCWVMCAPDSGGMERDITGVF